MVSDRSLPACDPVLVDSPSPFVSLQNKRVIYKAIFNPRFFM